MVGVCEFKGGKMERGREGERKGKRETKTLSQNKMKKLKKKKQHMLDPLKYTLRSRISIQGRMK